MRISDWSSDVCSSDLWRSDALALGRRARCACRPHARGGGGDDPGRNQIGRASCRGKSGSVRVDLGGRRIIKKKKRNKKGNKKNYRMNLSNYIDEKVKKHLPTIKLHIREYITQS